jgi:glutathione S-transferase
MRKLYHIWLCPYSRKVRLALREMGLDFDLEVEKFWERRDEFLALNPTGQVPVLIEEDGLVLCESQAICEYIDEVHPKRSLIGFDPGARAETRRLVAWFDLKFAHEVTLPLVYEKLFKRFMGLGGPDSAVIRQAQHALRDHLGYLGWLSERRTWLAGADFGLADLTAAAHLSSLDYMNDIPWDDFEAAKDWYMRLKSRPSFRPLLAEHVPGLPAPKHYAVLDF